MKFTLQSYNEFNGMSIIPQRVIDHWRDVWGKDEDWIQERVTAFITDYLKRQHRVKPDLSRRKK